MSSQVHPGPDVEVRRSNRRVKTVHATWRDGRILVTIPGWFSAEQEAEWTQRMAAKLQHRARSPRQGDTELSERAQRLAARYLPGGPAPVSLRWVTNQGRRWGSCTPATGEIRISHRVRDMPAWVGDYVVLHELAHLQVSGHSAAFWQLLRPYPHLERARAFLQGVSYAWDRGGTDDPHQLPDDEADS